MPKGKLSAYNRHVQKEMKAGKTMKQAAASWKKGGKRKTLAQRARSVRSHATRKASSPKARSTGGRNTTSKGGFNTSKIMKYIRLGALAAPAALRISQEGFVNGGKGAIFDYTGFNLSTGQFSAAQLAKGWGPYAMSVLVTYGIPKLAGILRSL